MTYCVGILLEQGLVLASDTRTNAGVDQVAITPKMHVFEVRGERVIVLLTAGNLAITQSVVNLCREQLTSDEGGPHLHNVSSLFEAASVVGSAMRSVHQRDGESLKAHGIDFSASILLAGQIRGEKPRLFNIYAAGNFIEATADTPYLQIGETKYGKPIIDRVIKHHTAIADAVKCVLISFDSTIRSNISVACPIDVMILPKDKLRADHRHRLTENDPDYARLRQGWGEGLKTVFSSLPDPQWSRV